MTRAAALAGATMGATWSARLSLPAPVSAAQAQDHIQRTLDTVVAQMSHWEPNSDLSRYNTASPGWHDIPDGFADVLRCALAIAADTRGAYDPTVGPLVDAWGFGPRGRAIEPPNAQALQTLRARCGWQKARYDAARQRVWQPGGLALDFSSIAKGYGVDQAALSLDALGCADYLVEVGGELRSRGQRPDGQPWRVAVETPDASGRQALTLRLADSAIATSGDYRRYIDGARGRYAHTLDPRTGQPVDNSLASVTVVCGVQAGGCMLADALATALTVLGSQEGMAYAQKRQLAALFIVKENAEHAVLATPAFHTLLG